LGQTITNTFGTWKVVSIIDPDNTNHVSADAVAGKKDSEADITAAKAAGTGKFWLHCGACDTYFEQSADWCSTCEANDDKAHNCNPETPEGLMEFSAYGGVGGTHCHKGADCYSYPGTANGAKAAYNDCGHNGCYCTDGGTSIDGVLYVQTSSTQLMHCLRSTTGSGGANDGTVDISVDSGAGLVQVATGSHALGAVVLDTTCYSTISSVTVMNPSNNAWTGSVEISSDGGNTWAAMTCSNCGGSTTTSASIVVDGNGDGENQATTQCLNGSTCNLAA